MEKKFFAKIFWRGRFYLQTDLKPYLTLKTETIDFKVAHLRNFDPNVLTNYAIDYLWILKFLFWIHSTYWTYRLFSDTFMYVIDIF